MEQQKEREKEKVGGRPAKLNEKKKTKETFFVGKTTRKFCSAGDQLSQGNLFSSKSEKKPLRMIWTILKQNKPEKPYK